MRRARFALALALAAMISALPASAAEVERAADVIDGVGLVDYMRRPNFKIGTWLKYQTKARSLRGHSDDYSVTVIVGGEEVFWGEPCVWIETWTEKGTKKSRTASLVSYSAFGDTMAKKHILWFLRKTVNGLKPDGKPDITIYTRDPNELKMRRANWAQQDDKTTWDTLGTDTTSVPAGFFDVLKVHSLGLHVENAEKGDSTIYYERRFNETYHYSKKIPLTSLARLEVDDIQYGKTWLAGKFERGDLNVLERVRGTTVLLAHGTDGVTPTMVPAEMRKPIDRKLIDAAYRLPSEAPTRVTRGGS